MRATARRVEAIAVDDDGLDVDALAAALAAGLRPKFVYTNPDHQNPGGVTLSGERRRVLVELAARYGFLVVEDVAYREFAYDRSPEPSLWTLDPGVVVQIGTFSKILSPGLRLGWAVGPADVVAGLAWAKQLTDQCASAFAQRIVEEYGRAGHLERQITLATALYAERCAVMMRALEAEMPAEVTWTRPSGGFFTWLTLPDGLDAADVVRRVHGRRRGRRPRDPVLPRRARPPAPPRVLQPLDDDRDRGGRRPSGRRPRKRADERSTHVADAHEKADTYFAHETQPEGSEKRSGTWYDLDSIDAVEFVAGLHMRPVVGDGVMVNFVSYEPGTVVPLHAHEEEQVTFVLEGEFEFEIDGETRTLRPGMAAHIPSHVPHAARTYDTSCTQVDVFVPPRRVLLDLLTK